MTFTESGSHISRSPTMPERPPLSLNPLLTTMNIQSPPSLRQMRLISKSGASKATSGSSWMPLPAPSLGYQVSDNRSVGPCILAMRMAFRGIKRLPEKFRFIADGYGAYPSGRPAVRKGSWGDSFQFDITQVIGLTNNDAVSKEFRPYKQMIERLNRTFKSTYRVSAVTTITMAPTITWRSGSPTTTFSVPISTTTIGCSIQSVCWRG